MSGLPAKAPSTAGILPRRILFLATDAHGGFGGISQYNRDVLEAFSSIGGVERVDVIPRLANTPVPPLPLKISYNLNGLGGRLRFIIASVTTSITRRPDLIYCAHINLLPAAILIKRMTGAPILLAIYGIDAWQAPRAVSAADVLAHVERVISISQITLDRFLDWCPMPAEQTRVCPNAIRLENYGAGPRNSPLAERLGIRDRKVLLTLGRMSASERYKGFDQVLDVLAEVALSEPNICYVLAGDGDDRSRLELRASELGLAGCTIFTGRISDREKVDLYRLADLYVMPSSGEGFGFVVLEALACGTPIVASNCDGTREAARGGMLGQLVNPDDREGLKAAIVAGMAISRGIPDGLRHFEFGKFTDRLAKALEGLVG